MLVSQRKILVIQSNKLFHFNMFQSVAFDKEIIITFLIQNINRYKLLLSTKELISNCMF